MKKVLFLALILSGLSWTLQAQRHSCGTSMQTQWEGLERLTANRNNSAHQESAGQRDVDYYVPVQFHVVGRTDGTQRASEADLLDMLCILNQDYADQDIQFYMKGDFNYIDNDALFSNAQSTGGELQITLSKVNDAINMYIVGTFPQSGLLGYYQGPWPSNDYIVIKKSAIFGNTASHEVGHFFSLAHPFFGWEPPSNPQDHPGYPNPYQGWEEQYYGNPVGNNSPSFDFSQPVPNEKVDQSNCTTAADRICDTPPDYLFAYHPNQIGCNTWNGGAMDPNGEIVDVMENNQMSYFSDCASFTFTPQQKAAIFIDLETPQRAYIRPNYTPSLEEIDGAPTLIEPIEGETTPGYNIVEFEWEPVDGAQKYFLEIDFQPTFAAGPTRYIVNGTYRAVEGIFAPNFNYYWRVRPVAEYQTCGSEFSESGTFKTGTTVSVGEIEAVNAWNIRPNPVTTAQILNIEVDAAETFEAQINLYNTSGQLLKTLNNRVFGVGTTNVEMTTADLTPGLYFVTINGTNGVMNKKVIVSR